MDDLLRDSVEALFSDHATTAAVRRAEAEGPDRALWKLVADAGFNVALVPEAMGGAGLTLSEVCALLVACGRYAAPLPLGEEILARGYAAAAGVEVPAGMGTAAEGWIDGGKMHARGVPWGAGADWVLVACEGRGYVFAASTAKAMPHEGPQAANEVDMTWPAADAAFRLDVEWRAAGAALRTTQIAGALETVLDMTIRYAGERVQFGRPLAKFQAIQQQVAVLAEETFAARMAAAAACESDGALPHAARAGAAKVVASEAAARACSIAHAVHGAMGIAHEHDLHLFTRRLLAWRTQYGSEAYWSERAGRALLSGNASAWEMVRAI